MSARGLPREGRILNRPAQPSPHRTISSRLLLSTALSLSLANLTPGLPPPFIGRAEANPVGGTVASGAATISQSQPNTVTINQQTDKAILDWRGFNIGKGETTQFNQPSVTSSTLNRVNSGGASAIDGALKANGNVFVVNPNGVIIGPGAHIDVGGLIATTADIRNENYNAGRLKFDQPSSNGSAVVQNAGTITVRDKGLAALVAPGVSNSGTITARLGEVTLAGSKTFAVDMYGDGLMSFAVGSTTPVTERPKNPDGAAVDALVSNSGKIAANGGKVFLTANAAAGIIETAVRSSGQIAAQSVAMKNGVVILSAAGSGAVEVSGTLAATGTRTAASTGGTVEVLGGQVGLLDGAKIDVSGNAGGGKVLVGGNFHGAGRERNAKATYVAPTASIRGDALRVGNGAQVAIWSDEVTNFFGTVSTRAGPQGGNGGSVEVSSKGSLDFAGLVDGRAPLGVTGTLLLDPANIIIQNGGNTSLNAGMDPYANNPGGTDTISPGTITTALRTSNVTLQATSTITVSNPVTYVRGNGNAANLTLQTQTGNIIVNAPVSLDTGAQLNATAGNQIVINSGGSLAGGANSTFNLTGSGTTTPVITPTSINISGPITLGNDSSLTLSGAASVLVNADVVINDTGNSANNITANSNTAAGSGGGFTMAPGTTLTSSRISLTDGSNTGVITLANVTNRSFNNNLPASLFVQAAAILGAAPAGGVLPVITTAANNISGGANGQVTGTTAMFNLRPNSALANPTIGTTAQPLNVNATFGVTAVSNGGNVYLQSTAGDLLVGASNSGAGGISAGTGSVFLTAAGSVLDFVAFGNPTLSQMLITAGSLNAVAQGTASTASNAFATGSVVLSTNIAATPGVTGTFSGSGAAAGLISIDNTASAGPLDLGAITAGTELNIVTTGDVTNSGRINVSGIVQIQQSAGNGGNAVNLSLSHLNSDGNPDNVYGTGLTISALSSAHATVDIEAGGALNLSVINNNQVSGNLTLVGSGIDVTSPVRVTGTTTLSAGADGASLADPNNALSGAVTVTSGGGAVLASTVPLTLGSGSNVTNDLRITLNDQNNGTLSSPALTQNGPVTVGGSLIASVGPYDLSLTDAGNVFTGAISLPQVTVSGTLQDGANNATIVNSVATRLGAMTVDGTLSVTSNGPITNPGAVVVAGTSSFTASMLVNSGNTPTAMPTSITLDNAGNAFTGAVTLTSGNAPSLTAATVVSTAPLTVGASPITGNVVLNAPTIAESAAFTVGGTTSLRGGNAAFTLQNALTGPVSLSLTGNATVINALATDIGGSVAGSLFLSSGGAISNSQPLTVAGTSSFTASMLLNGGNSSTLAPTSITLDNAGNAFTGAVTVGGNDRALTAVTVVSTAPLTIGSTTQITGSLLLKAPTIAESAAFAVGGATSLTAGIVTFANQGNSLAGPIFLNISGNATVTNSATTDIGGVVQGNLVLTSYNNIVNSQPLTVGGTSYFSAVQSSQAAPYTPGTINLGSPGDSFGGVVTLAGNTPSSSTLDLLNVNIASLTPVTLQEAVPIDGALAVTAPGIAESGRLSVGGATTLTAGVSPIRLPSTGNAFTGTISIPSAGAVSIVNSQATALGGVTAGSLTLTSGGAINGAQPVILSGGLTVATGTTPADITLTGANMISGAISASSARTVILTNDQATILGPISISGDLDLAAGGAVSSAATIQTGGNVAISETAAGANVTLDNPGNAISGAVSLGGNGNGSVGDATVVNGTPLILASNSVSGSFTAQAPSISVAAGSGSITAGQNVTLTTNGLTLSGPSTGAGTLTIQPLTAPTSIGVGSGARGTLTINTPALAQIGANFRAIVIGRPDGSGAIDIESATFRDPVTFQAPAPGGSIYVGGFLTGTGRASLTLIGSGGTTTLAAALTTSGQQITIADRVLLANDVTLTSLGAGSTNGAPVTITGAVDAAPTGTAAPATGQVASANRSLTINAGSAAAIINAVGQSAAPRALAINAGSIRVGSVTTAPGSSALASGQSFVASTTALNGSSYLTGGGPFLSSGNTQLGAATTLIDSRTGRAANAPGGIITFSGQVTGQSLTLAAGNSQANAANVVLQALTTQDTAGASTITGSVAGTAGAAAAPLVGRPDGLSAAYVINGCEQGVGCIAVPPVTPTPTPVPVPVPITPVPGTPVPGTPVPGTTMTPPLMIMIAASPSPASIFAGTVSRTGVLNLISGPYAETLQGTYTVESDSISNAALRSADVFAQPPRLNAPALFSPVERPPLYDPVLEFSSPGDKDLW